MNLITNQYSMVTVAVGLTIVAGLILLTNKPKIRDFIAFGVLVAALVSTWAVLHPRQTLLMGDAQKVQEMIGAGKPVLLEFQSPY